ncbi:MAG TPA: hypothetical protein PKE04_07320 [Clostridia bacterium]|nr:hypothetical protein [Clostridia bacterium]
MPNETILGTAAVIPRGPYDPGADYKRANVVYQGGRAYMALLPSKGIPVGNALYWMLLVEPSPAPVVFGKEFPDNDDTVLLVNTQAGGVFVEDLPARKGGTLGARMNAIDDMVMLTDNNRALTEQYKNESNRYRQEAAGSAEEAEDFVEQAKDFAQIAANNILNGVAAHNGNEAAHPAIHGDIQRVEAIARGRATAYVFDTHQGMLDWLDVPGNAEGLVVGDNLYIRDVNVKDYWWDGTGPSELEAEAPDLTNYYSKSQVDALLPIYLSESDYAAMVAAGTTEAGRVYYPIPDEYWEGT